MPKWQLLGKGIWAIFLFTLPVTSFPFFPPAIGGEALVRPLSLYPLAILLVLVILPRIVKQTIPKSIVPLLIFTLVAFASSLLSLLRGIEPALGISASDRIVRGSITLLMGFAIYLTIAIFPRTIADLRYTMRWIYAGCAASLLWGSMQAYYILHFNQGWYDFLSGIQKYISIRRLLPDRISGLTYEPHWFAAQIILLILPGTLAAVFTGYTVFRWRWRWITGELLLLLWAVFLLPFTFSRAGAINLLALIAISYLCFRNWKRNSLNPKFGGTPIIKQSLFLGRKFLELILVLAIVAVPIYFIGGKNLFFARAWDFWMKDQAKSDNYLSYLGFDIRVIYSKAAYRIYETHPLLGVGLGNYALYFEEMMPYVPVSNIPEVLRMVTPDQGRERLITSKNLYLRLLSETGIIGTILFLAFVITSIGFGLYLFHSRQAEQKSWGIAGLCGLIAFVLSAFTFDSFAIPNMWVVFGLNTAAVHVFMRTTRAHDHHIDQTR